jgi:hypothetical protein
MRESGGDAQLLFTAHVQDRIQRGTEASWRRL